MCKKRCILSERVLELFVVSELNEVFGEVITEVERILLYLRYVRNKGRTSTISQIICLTEILQLAFCFWLMFYCWWKWLISLRLQLMVVISLTEILL